MRVGIGTPPTGGSTSGVRSVVSSLRTETWLTGRPDGTQAERIVSSWSWDSSRTILLLRLRQDVYFHDGTKLTPEIAAAALRISKEEVEAASFESIRSVQVEGPDGIAVTVSEPTAFIVPDLALVSVRLPGRPEIGTGPFRTAPSAQAGERVTLEAFPQYYRGRPAVDQIDISTYPTQRNAWAALMRGEIDMLYDVSRDAAEFVQAESGVKTYAFPRPYYIPLVFNVRHPVLRRPEARRAINEALDKVTLVREGLNGTGRPADGPIWPEHWAHANPPEPFEFRPAAARARLDAAGLRLRPGVGGQMPSRFTFTCLIVANDDRFQRLAVLVQKQLAEVGIDMKLMPLEFKAFQERAKSGQFDAFLYEMFGRSLTFAYDFWHSGDSGLSNSGYRAADNVLDRMRRAGSDDDVRATVAEFARVLNEDPPAAFIAWQATARAVSIKFDVAAEENRDIMTNAWQWKPAAAGQGAR
jgi:peptide/nickel transport system substrate-binding protein